MDVPMKIILICQWPTICRKDRSRKSIVETFAALTRRRVKSQSLLKLDARRRKNIGGRKAGFARSQCPEKHPGTQGCLRQEAILSLFVDTDKFRLSRPIRSIEKEHCREFAHSQEERDSEQDHLRMTRFKRRLSPHVTRTNSLLHHP